jgi:hypothetical protein
MRPSVLRCATRIRVLPRLVLAAEPGRGESPCPGGKLRARAEPTSSAAGSRTVACGCAASPAMPSTWSRSAASDAGSAPVAGRDAWPRALTARLRGLCRVGGAAVGRPALARLLASGALVHADATASKAVYPAYTPQAPASLERHGHAGAEGNRCTLSSRDRPLQRAAIAPHLRDRRARPLGTFCTALRTCATGRAAPRAVTGRSWSSPDATRGGGQP